MQATSLFDLAFQRNEWLAERQSAIASNIANANTPNYRTKDVAAFEKLMAQGDSLSMVATHPAHIAQESSPTRYREHFEVRSKEQLISGNNVNIENEFLKSGEVIRDYSMNSQIIKAFHRMQLASTKV